METENLSFNGKVAVIIGGSSGIGHHTALGLLEKGYTVYNCSRTSSEDTRVKNVLLDVEADRTISGAIDAVLNREEKIDLLVYSAGISMIAPIEYIKNEDMYKLFEINFFGAIKIIQKIIPVMRSAKNGRIILISSMAGMIPFPFDALYSSSKAALDALAKELNIELMPYNIKTTAVQPGGTSTRFTFKRKVYEREQVGEYYDAMQQTAYTLAKKEQDGMTPEAVAETIVNVAEMEAPPDTVACGFKNKAVKMVHKILPDKASQFLNKNQYE